MSCAGDLLFSGPGDQEPAVDVVILHYVDDRADLYIGLNESRLPVQVNRHLA